MRHRMGDTKFITAAGKRGKTKSQLAARLGVGHSYVSRRVNALVAAGLLEVKGYEKPSVGRPAPRYGRVAT